MRWTRSLSVIKANLLSAQQKICKAQGTEWLSGPVLFGNCVLKNGQRDGKVIKWQGAYFLLSNHSFLFSFTPVPSTQPSPFLLLINKGAHNTQRQSQTPFRSPLYHSAAEGAVLADLHWLLRAIPYPCCSRRGGGKKKKKEKKNPTLLIHQSNTCQTAARENNHRFLFLFFFFPSPPVLFVPLLDKYLSRLEESGGSADPPFVHFFNNTFGPM